MLPVQVEPQFSASEAISCIWLYSHSPCLGSLWPFLCHSSCCAIICICSLFCDHPEATQQDHCRFSMHQIKSVLVLQLAGQALAPLLPLKCQGTEMPVLSECTQSQLHQPSANLGPCLLPRINLCSAAMHNQSFKFLGQFITISLPTMHLVFFTINPQSLQFWELLSALLCFSSCFPLMQIPTFLPPSPPAQIT